MADGQTTSTESAGAESSAPARLRLVELRTADDPQTWTEAGFAVVDRTCTIGTIRISFDPADVHVTLEDQASPDRQRAGRAAIPQATELPPSAHMPQATGITVGALTVPPDAGLCAWGFSGWFAPTPTLAGIAAFTVNDAGRSPDSETARQHPNGIDGFDHIVVVTETADATIDAFERAGMVLRRRRPVEPMGIEQCFLRAGDAIIELICPYSPTSDSQPADTDPGDHARTMDPPDGLNTASEAHAAIWGIAVVSSRLEQTVEYLGARISEPRPAVQPGRRIATIRTSQLGISTEIAVMTPHIPTRPTHA